MIAHEQRNRLYIATSLPETDCGGWGAILLTSSHRCEFRGYEPAVSTDHLGLQAIIAGLRATEQSSAVRIVTKNQRLHSGITTNIWTWQQNGWRAKNGQVIHHYELWQRVFEFMQICTVESSLGEDPADAILTAQAKRLANRSVLPRARRAG